MTGVTWDEGPDAGRWVADTLEPFGPTIGHAVPLGHPAYAVVPVAALEALVDLLGPSTPVHCGMWDGWGWWWYDIEPPDAEKLALPHRDYYLWTGPLLSATAFGDSPPSLIWPDDRSWFVGVPIYTNEIAVGGTAALVDAILADARLDARRATPDDVLDIDD